MKQRVTVVFNPPRDQWAAAQRLFIALGESELSGAPQRKFGYTLKFADPSGYEAFVKAAESVGFPQSSYITREARPSEPRDLEAPLLWLKATGKPQGLGGPTYGTTYDLSRGCPRCGTGSPQISPLFVRPSHAPRRSNVWSTLDGEILLDAEISGALDGATGAELRQALSGVDATPLPWFQLLPIHELPRMASTTVGIYQSDRSRTAACPHCHRDGYFTRREYTIRYELNLSSVPDVSSTYEHFGRSVLAEPFAKSHFAQRLPIVRGSMFERLIGAGARDLA
jgi:hypothetical protein